MVDGALIYVRLRPETARGETERSVHLVRLPQASTERLHALCGADFAPAAAERVAEPEGMPCLWCLLLS